MTAYRRKLEVIDAMQFTDADSANAIQIWSRGLIVPSSVLDPQPDNPDGLYLELRNGTRVIAGDWLIKGTGEQFTIIKPGPFEATYIEGDAANDLPKTASNPQGIERRKLDTGAPERRGLGGRSNEALRAEVDRLSTENVRLKSKITTAVTNLQVLKDVT